MYPEYLRLVGVMTTRMRDARQHLAHLPMGSVAYHAARLRLEMILTDNQRLTQWKTRFIRQGVMGELPALG